MKITPIVETDIHQLIQIMCKRYRQLHLLIDPKINDTFIFESPFDYQAMIPIRDRQDSVSADDECLQLCTIDTRQLYIKDILEQLKNRTSSVIGVIFSPYSNHDIQRHISNTMFLRYQASLYFFRFYDPKVLKHLVTIFNQKQLCSLLGGIEYWYYWNNNQYIELCHSPNLIISDIDYQITTQQWHQLLIAQSFNYYENVIFKKQQFSLTQMQAEQLKKLIDWGYSATYDKPDKEKLDYFIHLTMMNDKQEVNELDYEIFSDLINNKSINQIKQYINRLKEGVKNVIAR